VDGPPLSARVVDGVPQPLCNPEQRLLVEPEPGRKLYPLATAPQLDPCSVTLALDNDIVDVGECLDATPSKA
jgi:hypothetical protein